MDPSHNNQHAIYLSEGSVDNEACSDIMIQGNYIHHLAPTGSGINMNSEGGTDKEFTNINIRYNKFEGFTTYKGYSMITDSAGDGTLIYDNVFIENATSGYNCAINVKHDSLGTSYGMNTRICNNIFYGYFAVFLGVGDEGTAHIGSVASFSNNICQRLSGGSSTHHFVAIFVAGSTLADSDRNSYSGPYSTDRYFHISRTDTTMDTLTEWQTYTSLDASTITTDPAFAETTNLTPSAISPTIDIGIAESPYFSTALSVGCTWPDPATTTRPHGNAWDIGAYEY
jgi:hypothetical protein